MKLLLVRHGLAVPAGEQGIRRDADRPLSPEGRRKTAEVARSLAEIEPDVGLVAASPLTRARETAELLASALRIKNGVAICRALQPGGEAGEFLDWLRGQTQEAVAAVGHMPDLARLASELLAGHPNADIEFRKAGACCLVFDGPPAPGRGRLEWLMQPRHLRAMDVPAP